jgi:hypothetical protein
MSKDVNEKKNERNSLIRDSIADTNVILTAKALDEEIIDVVHDIKNEVIENNSADTETVEIAHELEEMTDELKGDIEAIGMLQVKPFKNAPSIVSRQYFLDIAQNHNKHAWSHGLADFENYNLLISWKSLVPQL